MISNRRKRLIDKAAKWVVTAGGAAIIAWLAAIFIFIAIEVYPLFGKPEIGKVHSFKAGEIITPPAPPLEKGGILSAPLERSGLRGDFHPIAIGMDEYHESSYIIGEDGGVFFFSPKNLPSSALPPSEIRLTKLDAPSKITSVSRSGDNSRLAFGTSDGGVLSLQIKYKISYDSNNKRTIEPEIEENDLIQIITEKSPVKLVAFAEKESDIAAAVYTEDGRFLFYGRKTTESLLDGVKTEEFHVDLSNLISIPNPESRTPNPELITSLVIDGFLENLYVGAESGNIYHFDIREMSSPKLIDTVKASSSPVTALSFLLGDVSLVAGDGQGGINIWFRVRDNTAETGWRLKKIHTLTPPAPSLLKRGLGGVNKEGAGGVGGAITSISPSIRGKGFLTASSDGKVSSHFATSEQTRFNIQHSSKPISMVSYSPKNDGLLSIDTENILYYQTVNDPHPEISFKSLFGKVWYEGYEKEEYVWQSTGGTDDFESKFSLLPLIYGTFKGTVYAMMFAIPIAVFGAIYTSLFMKPWLKEIIKPVIEIMAALPSVVLGFLAGLWLAPLVEKRIPAIMLMLIVIPFLSILSSLLWRSFPLSLKRRFNSGNESLLLIPVFILGMIICLWMNYYIENLFFTGDFRNWYYNTLGLRYDQRNALVVGFAMGFAVIPIIFTISEDALSNVPKHLISGSLALGATLWQTAVRVVLASASPGIFSAIMIGFGRAVGETMIVLMATGNTPIMEWNIFNGFRTLSANIAVEIPEAPAGGTLYRVLFLAALLLFIVTFMVNTAAEVVRQRLKKKYAQL
jgi:phosphate transport system permease protein